MDGDLQFSTKALPRSRLRHVGQPVVDWTRDGESPLAVPGPSASSCDRRETLEALAGKIRTIERSGHAGLAGRAPDEEGWRQHQTGPSWTLGIPDIDRRLGPEGLEAGLELGALHEIKPQAITAGCGGDWTGAVAASLSFALMLALRRLGAAEGRKGGEILWCWPASLAAEIGGLHVPGLADLGLDPTAFILVEPDKAADVLWAMEEGLRTPGLALVAGVLREIAFTPARRLSLAAAAHAVPCLLVTNPGTPVTGATSTRWRTGKLPSAPHPLADRLDAPPPGAPRFSLALERSRANGLSAPAAPWTVEWSYATRCFRLASPPADRAHAPARSEHRQR